MKIFLCALIVWLAVTGGVGKRSRASICCKLATKIRHEKNESLVIIYEECKQTVAFKSKCPILDFIQIYNFF